MNENDTAPSSGAPGWAQLSGQPTPADPVHATAGPGGSTEALRSPVPPSVPPPMPPSSGPSAPVAAPNPTSRAPSAGPPAAAQPVSWMDMSLDEDGAAAPADRRSVGARRRPGMVAVAALGAGVLLVGGFAAGRVLTAPGTDLTAQQAPAGQAGQLQGGQGGQAPGGQVAPGGDGFADGFAGGPRGAGDATMTMGQVVSVSGSTLTLTGRGGQTTTVRTTSTTTVDGTAGRDLSALSVGDVVLVQGSAGSDGSWTATSIVTSPLGRRGGQEGPDPAGGQAGDTSVTT